MASKLVYSTLLPDKNKKALSQYDVLDRIINLKIYTAKRGTDENGSAVTEEQNFVIRSDYEITYPGQSISSALDGKISGKYLVQRCSYKPSIKVQYTQATDATNIGVDIYIGNFYMTTSDGKNLMSITNSGYRIVKVEVMMGYLGQFRKLLGLDAKPLSSLTPSALTEFKAGLGVDLLTLSEIGWVATESLPPDYALHIHAFVGSTASSPEGEPSTEGFASLAEDAYFSVSDGESVMEKAFFRYVTRRFLNQKSFAKTEKKPLADVQTGLLSEADAEKYGVKVTCSTKVKELVLPSVSVLDAEGNPAENLVYAEMGGIRNTATGAIQQVLGCVKQLNPDANIKVRRMNDGNFVAYLSGETSPQMIEDLYRDIVPLLKDGQVEKEFKNVIPAVYSVNIDNNLVTLICPYFSWVEPFQKLIFASRYATTSLVEYYTGQGVQTDEFYATSVSVTFATVEDINEMHITAVPV